MNTWQFGGVTLYQGNCLDVLPTLPAESVQACITSPPYWGLRDYGTARWEGGDSGCDHRASGERRQLPHGDGRAKDSYADERHLIPGAGAMFRDACLKCGAIRIDQQLGLERVPDCLGWATRQPCGECYVCHTVAWAREVRRALRDDGVMFLVLGDSYNGSYPTGGKNSLSAGGKLRPHGHSQPDNPSLVRTVDGLKPKDLCGIPWRVALALQADGWWLRSDVIWAKPNPMPESVTDRPTKAHEYVFLLAKSARYYWDADAVRRSHCRDWTNAGGSLFNAPRYQENSLTKGAAGEHRGDGPPRMNPSGANIKTVWNIATQPYAGAHFAVFPEKLVEPMVKAATSERGCCPKCGKAWERVTEVVGYDRQRWAPGEDQYHTKAKGKHGITSSFTTGDVAVKETMGWHPACACGTRVICPACGGRHQDDAGNICETCGGDCEITEPLDPTPCTILDPFGGSGTVASVALRLGRRAILCELNPDYIELQKERVGQTQPALFQEA